MVSFVSRRTDVDAHHYFVPPEQVAASVGRSWKIFSERRIWEGAC
jgi:hypothetical protein